MSVSQGVGPAPFEQLALPVANKSILSPKRPRIETAGIADIFPYYAGFSYEWALDQLVRKRGSRSQVVLDPWNGSGTTSLAAQAKGLNSIGVDLNPVAGVVARLRVQARVNRLRVVGRPSPALPSFDESADPLSAWFTPANASRLRCWERTFRGVGGDSEALGLVAMFRVVRRLTAKFEGSNPTWVRRMSDPAGCVSISQHDLDFQIVSEQKALKQRIRSRPPRRASSAIVTASAMALPLASGSVSAILTSPPYLTRIDYAVAYSRELAVLGIGGPRERRLRSSLMGTTMARPDALKQKGVYEASATELVERIAEHPSKASGGYYLKQVRQYLDDLTASLDELTRVASGSATLTLVVQDSYYKDVPVPLAKICTEESVARGWTDPVPAVHEVKRTLTHLNTAARAYPKGRVAETVISLRRG